ncbi:MAG: hypothetical protein UX79_C0037G0006 [candidate division WWE3 bacterium GW2011_GWB1_47_11]|uniref:Uncharacterized protein n=2 Tax=Katanobacteria TaxID=422282 RepID=A0A0G1RFC2_UNCKA|nr:MAG: hypothetical protein UX69_C0009G0002 [candidate division WWE3 bacterium GW2011_GWA2_46_9]KKU56034.1 MAG: hypothetical protein UX79_C0037G0006 [candidate division WWE3 bacterium GW2011_GWB1_47_11]
MDDKDTKDNIVVGSGKVEVCQACMDGECGSCEGDSCVCAHGVVGKEHAHDGEVGGDLEDGDLEEEPDEDDDGDA